jgi:oxygen-independent coproporphyrinogen-3 oxidase
MCHFETRVENELFLTEIQERLSEMIKDGLVEINGQVVQITDAGIPFVRNACMAFDRDLIDKEQREGLFSKTV